MNLKLWIVLILSLVLIGFLQLHYDSKVDYFAEKDTFVTLPSSKTIKIFSFGYTNFVADMLFIWSIQFYSTSHLTNRFDYVEPIFNLITDLNPQYREAYYYGAIIMALEAKEYKMAIRLLQKGSRNLTQEWIFDFESAFYAYKYLKDYKLAENFYFKASQRPDAPSLVKRGRAHMVYIRDDLTLAYELWMELYKTAKNRLEKDAAQNHLYQIKFEMDKIFLEKKIELYKKRYGRFPVNLKELKRMGYISKIPKDYNQNDYLYDAITGKIKAQRVLKWKKLL